MSKEPMRKGAILAVLLVLMLSAGSLCAEEAIKETDEGSKVLASVGDKVLLLEEFNSGLELLQFKEQEDITLEKKKALVENWILTQIMADEALKRGFAEREDVKSRLGKSRARILSEVLLREELTKITATDEDVSKYYESHQELFTIPETVRLGVITLGTQEEAKAVLKRLSAGEDFAKVAKAVSIDKYRDSGGDAGIVAKSEKLPEYIRVAFYLQEGSLSDVIHYQEGYCILKAITKSSPKTLTFEELSPKLKAVIKKRALREKRLRAILQLQTELEKKVGVKRNLGLLEN